MDKSKEKVIFLFDCQSFYTSVEKAAHLEYPNQPLIITMIWNGVAV